MEGRMEAVNEVIPGRGAARSFIHRRASPRGEASLGRHARPTARIAETSPSRSPGDGFFRPVNTSRSPRRVRCFDLRSGMERRRNGEGTGKEVGNSTSLTNHHPRPLRPQIDIQLNAGTKRGMVTKDSVPSTNTFGNPRENSRGQRRRGGLLYESERGPVDYPTRSNGSD